LHGASSHIQSKVLSAAAAASQHPNTTPKFTHGSPSLLPESRLPQTPTLLPWPKSELKKDNQKKYFAVGNQILTKSFFLRQIKPTHKQRAM
jgi:hypothetical protein